MKDNKVYVVIGETEEVFQITLDGPFQSIFSKEIVNVYSDKLKAENFINANKLKKPIKKTFSGTRFYKNGYYSLEIEEHYII